MAEVQKVALVTGAGSGDGLTLEQYLGVIGLPRATDRQDTGE